VILPSRSRLTSVTLLADRLISGLTLEPPSTILKAVLKYQDAEPLSVTFQALADPTRRSIVERLSRGSASVSELAAPLAISLPAVHQHLQVLEHSGLVRSEKVGRVRTCHLEPTMLQTAEKWIEQRREMWERRLERLDAFLATLPPEEPNSRPVTKGNQK
jgi:DNA-binding transcriptional ArsR family regulator